MGWGYEIICRLDILSSAQLACIVNNAANMKEKHKEKGGGVHGYCKQIPPIRCSYHHFPTCLWTRRRGLGVMTATIIIMGSILTGGGEGLNTEGRIWNSVGIRYREKI